MNIICSVFGHNYSLLSRFGMQAYCTKCGHTLVIRDPFHLQIGERRFIDQTLYEQTELELQPLKLEEEKE